MVLDQQHLRVTGDTGKPLRLDTHSSAISRQVTNPVEMDDMEDQGETGFSWAFSDGKERNLL